MRVRIGWLLAVACLACDDDGGGGAGTPDGGGPRDSVIADDAGGRDGAIESDAAGDAMPPADAAPDSAPGDASRLDAASADGAPSDATATRDAANPPDGDPVPDAAGRADASPRPDATPPDDAEVSPGDAIARPDAAPSPDAAEDADGAALPDAAPLADASPPDPDGPPPCEHACDADARRCSGPAAFQACVAGPEGCRVFGEAQPCEAEAVCDEGACVPAPLPALLVNEVFYDAAAGDAPHVFIELWGLPGTPLAGLSIVAVNGNGGAAYATIPLAGALPADGFFVLAHPDAAPELRAVADQLHAGVDLQNGPDSVQLRRRDQVIDALGYGDFDGAVFAGEGTPAPGVSAQSLTRDAAHSDTDDNAADFAPAAPSPGVDPRVCEPVCAAGASRCVGSLVERCAPVDDCPAWVVAADCAETGELCREGLCLAPPECGNGDVEPPETCDDENQDPGDGCDEQCREEDPFDDRAILLVRPPAGAARPDHVPDDLGATSYGGAVGLTYDNDRYFVFEVADELLGERRGEAPLGHALRLEPGSYVVVLNDTFARVDLDWEDRVILDAGRIEVASPFHGTYTVIPPRRFDDLARPLPLRGCGQFGNQVRSPWIFGGCDGEIGGGAVDLNTGLHVLPANYRVSVTATFHSPNATFVEVRPGETTVYEPRDTRARIEVLAPPPGALPDWVPMGNPPSYGPRGISRTYDNETYHVYRFVNVAAGFEYVAVGSFGHPAVVPAGHYFLVMNDTYLVVDVEVGQHLQIPAGRIEIAGAGAYDVVPHPDVRRFTYVGDMAQCSRNGPETYLFASCAFEQTGRFARGTGFNLLAGTYTVRIYDPMGALIGAQEVVVDP